MSSKMKTTTPPPAYELHPLPPRPSTDTYTTLDNPFSSLHRLSTSSSAPPSPTVTPSFHPTHSFQIETPGKIPLLPYLPRPGPIPIFPVPGTTPTPTPTPAYLSLRPIPSSGSSFLIAPGPGLQTQGRPLSTTTYRFGPGRPPIVRLFRPGHHAAAPTSNPFTAQQHDTDTDTDTPAEAAAATFPLTSPRLFPPTRSVTFPCPPGLQPSWTETGPGTGPVPDPGSFTWHYPPRAERKALGFSPRDSVLALEYVHPTTTTTTTTGHVIFPAYPNKPSRWGRKPEEEKTVVAVLVRNAEYRSRGTDSSAAGNGGRVMVDCGFFSRLRHEDGGLLGGHRDGKLGEDGEEEEEERREMGVVMVLTTALVMLKKEVDRS
ncbi:hypothetical protein QBC39DRAFT_414509 [Podospora conica]|nr:hypothetical protein QBC39DRAFT_414509 [Schizothecium conicum]